MGRGGLHSSEKDRIPHWLVRGVQNGIAYYAFHVYDVESGGTRPTARGWLDTRNQPLNMANFKFVTVL
jgi:hypothetical protein